MVPLCFVSASAVSSSTAPSIIPVRMSPESRYHNMSSYQSGGFVSLCSLSASASGSFTAPGSTYSCSYLYYKACFRLSVYNSICICMCIKTDQIYYLLYIPYHPPRPQSTTLPNPASSPVIQPQPPPPWHLTRAPYSSATAKKANENPFGAAGNPIPLFRRPTILSYLTNTNN